MNGNQSGGDHKPAKLTFKKPADHSEAARQLDHSDDRHGSSISLPTDIAMDTDPTVGNSPSSTHPFVVRSRKIEQSLTNMYDRGNASGRRIAVPKDDDNVSQHQPGLNRNLVGHYAGHTGGYPNNFTRLSSVHHYGSQPNPINQTIHPTKAFAGGSAAHYCDKCPRSFESEKGLLLHKAIKHQELMRLSGAAAAVPVGAGNWNPAHHPSGYHSYAFDHQNVDHSNFLPLSSAYHYGYQPNVINPNPHPTNTSAGYSGSSTNERQTIFYDDNIHSIPNTSQRRGTWHDVAGFANGNDDVDRHVQSHLRRFFKTEQESNHDDYSTLKGTQSDPSAQDFPGSSTDERPMIFSNDNMHSIPNTSQLRGTWDGVTEFGNGQRLVCKDCGFTFNTCAELLNNRRASCPRLRLNNHNNAIPSSSMNHQPAHYCDKCPRSFESEKGLILHKAIKHQELIRSSAMGAAVPVGAVNCNPPRDPGRYHSDSFDHQNVDQSNFLPLSSAYHYGHQPNVINPNPHPTNTFEGYSDLSPNIDSGLNHHDQPSLVLPSAPPLQLMPRATPYYCEQCGRSFETEKGLVLHNARKHPERAYTIHRCDQCPRTFETLGALFVHTTESHPEFLARIGEVARQIPVTAAMVGGESAGPSTSGGRHGSDSMVNTDSRTIRPPTNLRFLGVTPQFKAQISWEGTSFHYKFEIARCTPEGTMEVLHSDDIYTTQHALSDDIQTFRDEFPIEPTFAPSLFRIKSIAEDGESSEFTVLDGLYPNLYQCSCKEYFSFRNRSDLEAIRLHQIEKYCDRKDFQQAEKLMKSFGSCVGANSSTRQIQGIHADKSRKSNQELGKRVEHQSATTIHRCDQCPRAFETLGALFVHTTESHPEFLARISKVARQIPVTAAMVGGESAGPSTSGGRHGSGITCGVGPSPSGGRIVEFRSPSGSDRNGQNQNPRATNSGKKKF